MAARQKTNTPPDPATLGGRIRQAREGKGLKIAHVARALGAEWLTVQNWENDKSAPGTPERVAKLAEVLGMTVEEMLGVAAGQEPPFAAWASFASAHPEITDDERKALKSIVWPTGHVPTIEAYSVMLTAIRMTRKM